MTDITMKRLYLHDDNVAPVITDTTISLQDNVEAHYILRGHSIGEIVKTSKGWLNFELDRALSLATATMRQIIWQTFLDLESFKEWEGFEDRVRVVMASRCIYLTFDRPDNSKLKFTPVEIESWTSIINNSQTLFEIGLGHILSGSPENGTIQFPYSLKDE